MRGNFLLLLFILISLANAQTSCNPWLCIVIPVAGGLVVIFFIIFFIILSILVLCYIAKKCKGNKEKGSEDEIILEDTTVNDTQPNPDENENEKVIDKKEGETKSDIIEKEKEVEEQKEENKNNDEKKPKKTSKKKGKVVDENRQIRIVVVGDGAVGKTCILYVFKEGSFTEDYIPTVFDNHQKYLEHEIDGEKYNFNLMLCDTAGQEDYQELRKLSYEEVDVFLLCYSIVDPVSFKNIKNKWMDEVTSFGKSSQIVLVGTKSDLREDQVTIRDLKEDDMKPITFKEGEHLAKKIKASNFIECSSKQMKNITEIFKIAIETFVNNSNKK